MQKKLLLFFLSAHNAARGTRFMLAGLLLLTASFYATMGAANTMSIACLALLLLSLYEGSIRKKLFLKTVQRAYDQNDGITLKTLIAAEGVPLSTYTFPIRHSLHTALTQAAGHGHTDTVRALIELGANANDCSEHGETALIEAARRGHTDTVRALFELGADVNHRDGSYTALTQAGAHGHTDTVRLLIQQGADVNHSDGFYTALTRAAESGKINRVRLLIELGADVNHSDGRGTALTRAAESGEINIVRLLIELGADVNYVNPWGKTALTKAAGAPPYRYKRKKQQKVEEALCKAADDQNIELPSYQPFCNTQHPFHQKKNKGNLPARLSTPPLNQLLPVIQAQIKEIKRQVKNEYVQVVNALLKKLGKITTVHLNSALKEATTQNRQEIIQTLESLERVAACTVAFASPEGGKDPDVPVAAPVSGCHRS